MFRFSLKKVLSGTFTLNAAKLSAMGVQTMDWFRSYLYDRKQIVNVNGVESDPLANSCGVH